MTGEWRRLSLAALAATAVAFAGVSHVGAQAPAKSAAQKAPAKGPNAEDGETDKAPAKKKRQDPAEAQHAIDAAVKLLEAGKAEPAAQSLSTVLGGGNLPPAIMAKALLYRGIAYRQQKKPAQAIADLTSALWLKGGLGETDRKDALRQRTSAYQEAGLSDSGEPVAPATPGMGRAPTRTASAGDVPDNGSPVQEDAPAPQGNSWGFSNPFSGWFGGSTSAPPSTPPQQQQQQPPSTTASIESEPSQPATAAPARRAATSGWSRNTQVRGGGTAEPIVAVADAARPEGKFRIQVGLARSQADAEALATRVKREHGAVLATRDPEIDETVVGNMGSFYRVRIGPFATAQEGQATCAKLKGPGIDCLVVTQ